MPDEDAPKRPGRRSRGSRPSRTRGPQRQRQYSPYTLFVGIAFLVLVTFAGINTLRTHSGGILGTGSRDVGQPLTEFAVPDARSDLQGDANIAQDNCKSASRPCPQSDVRTPACKVDVPGAIRVCDLFDKPLALLFWFTKGGDCETDVDSFEAAYRKYKGSVNFLSIDVRDSRDKVRSLIASHGWTQPIGLDSDGALSNLYRVGGCPTFIYVYPGGIVQDTSIEKLDPAQLEAKIEALKQASAQRAAAEKG